MRTIERQTPVATVLKHSEATAVIEEIAPDFLQNPMLRHFGEFPIGPAMTLLLGETDIRGVRIMEQLAAFEDDSQQAPDEPVLVADPHFEPATVPSGSASVQAASPSPAGFIELSLHGPAHGNPYVDVDLSADFRQDDILIHVNGFYDCDGIYRIRFLPPRSGRWAYLTSSTARSMHGIEGALDVEVSLVKGPVRVAGQFGFAHSNGDPFFPLGTTAYAWIHQDEGLQDATIQSLTNAPFTKLRMCLFPKDYLYNSNEPELFVFPRSGDGFDNTRFDAEFFALLERRISQLHELNIQAELILFHPYDDRWGFAKMSAAADDRYIRYVVRRLAAFPNIWWSMANEYDLLITKRTADWDRLGRLVATEDHVGHPVSIHNWVELYDADADWASHASIQRGDYRIGKKVDEWRQKWSKPVVIDEFGYEGDLDQGWGNLTAEDVVRFAWEASIRGGYITHGETYYSKDEVIWWSKGGPLRGDSPARLAFLRRIVEESPTGRLEPLPSEFDCVWGGITDDYVLIYFGSARPLFRNVTIPAGMTAYIDVIDTWNMTVDQVPGTHSGTVKIDLPARPYIAIRLRRAEVQ